MQKEKVTKEQIDEAIKELGDALKEALQIDQDKVIIAEKDRLNRTRLLNARSAIRELRVDY